MPKPILFSIGIKGIQRSLFTIQERASGDITIIIKHSKFSPGEEGGRTNESDTIVEQRCSVHRTPKNDQINVIKSTTILKDGRAFYTRNYNRAIKSERQFAGIFIRRAG